MEIIEQLRTALSGTYEIDRQLGAGGMGSVFLGRDRTLDRPVAIKVINPEFGASATVRDRFLQEARTIARLQHPNIVGVYAAGETNGLLYFVMEYVPGESLRDLLDREKKLSTEKARHLLHDMAAALAYAHRHGVIHRDIKPENVLLREGTGEAKLADFGVARALSGAEGDSRLTGTGMVVGTPRYMSPEQASGERTLDGRSDIYSLGLIGYEMFAGEPAFVGDTPASVIVKQITTVPPPLHDRAAEVPREIEAVIEKAIEKDPANRWQDAGEMQRALGGDEKSISLATAPRAARRRRRTLTVVGIAAALVAAAGLTYWATARSEIPRGVDPRKSFFVVPFENQTGDPSLAWLREGSMNMLTLNLGSWRDLKVVDYERGLDLLREGGFEGEARIGLEGARDIARQAGAWTLVMGQINRTADSLVVTARVYDVARGNPVRPPTVLSAPMNTDPRLLFDRLSRALLDIAGAPAMSVELAKSTSSSIGAYQAYLAGVGALSETLLDSADRSFERAIRADSTFALAYYKYAMSRGWRPVPNDSSPLMLSRQAARYSARLPVRERGLIEAHLALSEGIAATGRGDVPAARTHLDNASKTFDDLIRRDSLDAEAWYGLADAEYHFPSENGSQRAVRLTRSLRGFNRALAIDSTFHLAYPHTIEIYTSAIPTQSPLVLMGSDSIAFVEPKARPALGASLAQSRSTARQAAVREGERWVDHDQDSPEAYDRLANAYMTLGQMDRAAASIRSAISRPTARRPDHYYRLAALEMAAGSTRAIDTLRWALREMPVDSLRRASFYRVPAVLGAASVGSYQGSASAMSETFDVLAGTDTTVRISGATNRMMPMTVLTDAFESLHLAAMGRDFARVRPKVDAAIRELDKFGVGGQGDLNGLRPLIPFFAFALSRDSSYGLTLLRWTSTGGTTSARLQQLPPAVQAINALRRGDTAAAQRFALQFARGDSTKMASSNTSMLDPFMEADVLTDLGDVRGAIASLEGIKSETFSTYGFADIRWPMYARSFLARGRLYEQIGEPAKAVQAYERFVALWDKADPEFQPQVQSARDALNRLRDTPKTTIPATR